MIMYLFYNVDLIEGAIAKGQLAVAFVDDANLYVGGDTYDKAYASLKEMLLKPGGGKRMDGDPSFQI